jgi:hypothetical protein
VKLTARDERIDRATRLAAVSLAVIVLAVFAVASVMLLAGCHVGWPCDNHGGVKWTNGKLYECNDGTWE